MSLPSWFTEARGFRADLIALLAGALAALALPPLAMLPLLLVAFPTLLWLINASGRGIVAARRGWWFGFGYHLVGLYWITEAILFEAARFWWLVPIAVPALAAVLAIFIAIPAWLAWFAAPPGPSTASRATDVVQNRSGAGQVMTLAGGWVLGDLARQFFATGFPWNPLGSVWAIRGQIGDVMLQPAALASVHGLTLVTIILACAPVLRRRGQAVCVALFLAWIGYGLNRVAAPLPPDQPLHVVLVQGNVPQGQKWDPAMRNAVFDRYLHLTDDGVRAAGPGPSVVVWPETASPFLLDTAALQAIAAAGHDETELVGAVRFDEDDRPRNSL
ncbi:MAG TPA: apolipoprotein N-acyltransferase, partial [Acetobacteraceae bacterium]|nr:apolipoprotein N-acyltransferase [Acetobacteraceae bacterium]